MKKIAVLLFIINFFTSSIAMAASVGGPALDIPEESLFLKKKAVEMALDRYEYAINIKASLDVEILVNRELTSSPADVTNAEMEGHSFMFKFSNNFNNIIEPYIKLGSSTLEVKWDQHGRNIKIETGTGFVWGAGVKTKIWEFENSGIDLTLDAQYINTDLDFDKAKVGGSVATTRAEDFKMDEWQISLLASKKLILPIGKSDYYIVPYTGLTWSSLDLDASFWNDTNYFRYLFHSTYNASSESEFGLLVGCDIMPFYLSYYLLNFELRLIDETAFTLGGTIKF